MKYNVQHVSNIYKHMWNNKVRKDKQGIDSDSWEMESYFQKAQYTDAHFANVELQYIFISVFMATASKALHVTTFNLQR